MRLLLSDDSRKRVFDYLIKRNECNSLKELATKLKIPYKTIQNWRYYKGRYLPEAIVPLEIKNELLILDKQNENWGKVIGGKKTYKLILEKYGLKEIRRRQSLGGKISIQKKVKTEKEIILNLNDPLFLEFYGVLLGDGWLSKLIYKDKITYLIGISGNAKKDRVFFNYLKKNIKSLFNRKAYLKERPKYNSIELNFAHKNLLKKMNLELSFPIGEKINLKIEDKIYNSGFEKVKYIIRGIFDTDGCFFLDKTPVGRPYPCITITMKSPILMKQIHDILIKNGFKAYHNQTRPVQQIRLKGYKQLNKWMGEIGSSNPRNLDKMALVAQLDSATAS